MERVLKLTTLFTKLKNSEYADLKEMDFTLLEEADAGEIALAQQNLLDLGISSNEVWKIWKKYRPFLPDQVAKMRAELDSNRQHAGSAFGVHESVFCACAREIPYVPRQL